MNRYFSLILLCVILAGCARDRQEVIIKIPDPLDETSAADENGKQPGSLWSKSNSSMFADHKARGVGDIVTVTIAESSSASKSASTSSNRSTNVNAGIPNFFGLEKNPYVVDSGVELGNLLGAKFDNSYKGSGNTVRSGKMSASLTTQVTGVCPNGNLKIRGGKEVMVNNEVQVIYLTGIVRPADITAANTIDSNKVLNARISYTGKGAVSDKQHPGWITRIVDNIWPF
ncbi:MAG: flagellar biosynthesis protein FlgH [Deltaproteobacteria bacterium]|nr:MAG: flagellar biosynthesis protein FlgH [Deltaproteobacteria bacterium]